MTAAGSPADGRPEGSPRGRRWQGLVPFAADVGRLLRSVATDDRVPRRAKVVAGVAAGYVLGPVDLVPDVIPVVGWMDDVVVVTVAVRYLLRHAGYELIREHWQGTDDGFALLLFIAGVER